MSLNKLIMFAFALLKGLSIRFATSLVSATIFVASLGILKELTDAWIDKNDLIADGFGILLAVAIILIIKTLWR